MLEPIVFACLVTVIMWLPYLGATAFVSGPLSVLAGDPIGDSTSDKPPLPNWVRRLRQAHANAAENLAAFVGVCIAANWVGDVPGEVIVAAYAYSYARIAHYIFYGVSIAFLRTAAFMVSWLSILFIGFSAIG